MRAAILCLLAVCRGAGGLSGPSRRRRRVELAAGTKKTSVAERFIATDEAFLARGVLLARAGLVGLTTGACVSLFKLSLTAVEEFAKTGALDDASFLAFAPACGGIVVAVLRAATPGFDDDLSSQKEFRPLKSTSRAAAAVATLGTGNSLGPEGTAVEIGRALASGIGRSSSHERNTTSSLNKDVISDATSVRVLAGAGAAAGVAAGFSAPIAGIFFALESASKEKASLPSVAISATALASSLSAIVATQVFPQCRLQLSTPDYVVGDYPLVQLPAYIGLGVLSGVVAVALQFALARSKEIWSDQGYLGSVIKLELRPVMGGLVCGLVGLACPQVLFNGYNTLNSLLEDTDTDLLTVATLARYFFIKAATTASCVGSGLVGGLFAPSLFLGATAGGAYGQVIGWSSVWLHDVLQSDLFDVADASAYATVGAASVLAALFQTPLTGAMLLFELTRDYDVILPLICSTGVASAVVAFADERMQTNRD